MKLTLALSLVGALVTAVALQGPAGADSRRVGDHEATLRAGDVEISAVKFSYGARRVSVRVQFEHLPENVEFYDLQARGPGGHTWNVGWQHEDQDWSASTAREKTFTHFIWPGGDGATQVRCATAWREDLAAKKVTLSFPVRCLRVKNRPVPWLRMTFGVGDLWEDSYIGDSAPGGNTFTPDPSARFTKRIHRG